jgi:glycine cleavage system H protein
MTFILVVLTFGFLVAIGLMRKSAVRVRSGESVLKPREQRSTPVTERFLHPGHMWALVSGEKAVTVGSDEFSERMIGTSASVILPKVGALVQQGEPIAILVNGKRSLSQLSPISGKIVEVNEKLDKHPSLFHASPLERGWIARIIPSRLDIEIRNLLRGTVADSWREAVRIQFIQMFAPKTGLVLQDGGQLIENIGEHFSDEEWSRIAGEFFHLTTVNPTQNKTTN